MKGNLPAILAVIAGIICNAFSTSIPPEAKNGNNSQTIIYLVYNSGPHCSISSYTQTTTRPNCPGAVRLCAIRVVDPNGDGVITQAEFSSICAALDTNSNGSLDDETESTTLLKKA